MSIRTEPACVTTLRNSLDSYRKCLHQTINCNGKIQEAAVQELPQLRDAFMKSLTTYHEYVDCEERDLLKKLDSLRDMNTEVENMIDLGGITGV